MSRAADDLLLPRIAEGDPGAVRACVERYSPLVWSLAKKLLSDVAEVEDLVQEVFIQLWKHADRYDPAKASEATFIATIARRRLIDRRRRRSSAPEQEGIEEDTASSDDPGLSGVDLSDEARRARAALAQLRPEQQRVIRMSVVDGLTHQEIAAASGIPLGTVKSHIRRGLERTARLLQESDGQESAP